MHYNICQPWEHNKNAFVLLLRLTTLLLIAVTVTAAAVAVVVSAVVVIVAVIFIISFNTIRCFEDTRSPRIQHGAHRSIIQIKCVYVII